MSLWVTCVPVVTTSLPASVRRASASPTVPYQPPLFPYPISSKALRQLRGCPQVIHRRLSTETKTYPQDNQHSFFGTNLTNAKRVRCRIGIRTLQRFGDGCWNRGLHGFLNADPYRCRPFGAGLWYPACKALDHRQESVA